MWKVLFALQNLRFGLESINLVAVSFQNLFANFLWFLPRFSFLFSAPTPLKTPHDTAIKIAFICPLLNHLSCIKLHGSARFTHIFVHIYLFSSAFYFISVYSRYGETFFFYFNTYTNIYIYIYSVCAFYFHFPNGENGKQKRIHTQEKRKKKNRTEACLGNNNKRNLFYTRMQKTTASKPPPPFGTTLKLFTFAICSVTSGGNKKWPPACQYNFFPFLPGIFHRPHPVGAFRIFVHIVGPVALVFEPISRFSANHCRRLLNVTLRIFRRTLTPPLRVFPAPESSGTCRVWRFHLVVR